MQSRVAYRESKASPHCTTKRREEAGTKRLDLLGSVMSSKFKISDGKQYTTKKKAGFGFTKSSLEHRQIKKVFFEFSM